MTTDTAEPQDDLPITDLSRVRRNFARGAYDRATVHAILDAQPLAHLGYVLDGRPMVTPTFQWREGDRVYWHGSAASRALRAARDAEVCLTVSTLDGLVLARSAFHHSVNYRSVMLFGTATEVTDPAEKAEKMRRFVEAVVPGRWDSLRPMTDREVKATAILGMPIAAGAAKVRTGPPQDDDADYALPIWAGVLPYRQVTDPPVPDPRNLPDVALPEHVARLLTE